MGLQLLLLSECSHVRKLLHENGGVERLGGVVVRTENENVKALTLRTLLLCFDPNQPEAYQR